MASTSTAEIKATWHEGDSCLAPNPQDGVLREARIQRLTAASHSSDATALVVFTDHKREDAEEEEEAIPVSELLRPGRNHFTQEKPWFPSSLTHPETCVPLELSLTGVGGDRVPYTINRYLRDYQREGIRFIYDNYIHSRGSILGDDMGLGKTVQVIGFLAAVLHKTGTWEDKENNRPQFLMSQIPSKQTKPNKMFLIVAPLSVLYNWKDELDTWGHFQCVVVHGLKKEEELARIRKGRIEIALTTYETLRLCLEQFNSVDWSAVIVDEAHKIKNPSSQITQAMKELRCQVRIGLTGTILQNNLEELWCVMDWAIPGCLGSLGHFRSQFSDPIEQGQRHSATKRALATGRKCVRALVRKISRWFLRRTKMLIKEQLPKKDDRVVYCSLTDFQQTVYQTVLDTEDVQLLLHSSDKCDCQSGHTRGSCCYPINSKKLYFSYLAILRKVANHVALLQSTAGTSKKQEKYVKAICEKVFQKFPDFVQRCKQEAFEAMSDPIYSGKMKVLQKLLKYYMQKKDKVLLFSLSTKLLDVLESYCMAEGLDYSRLDGTTKAKERVKIVKDFNSCPHTNLCLVSTMAGGLGLNFVGANVVVLFDPTWNPANDLQAIDRAYRIGQCRDVTVLRLISLGTVEEIIYLRQVYKQQLQCSVVGKESARRYFEAVQRSDDHKGELFGMKNLFRLQTQGTCLTRKILEREGRVEAGIMTTSTHTGEEKEEERKRVSEPGDASTTKAPKLNDEIAKENRDASKIPRGVLDFSSGSEDDEEEHGARRKASDAGVVNGAGDGNASTTPGRMSLLQHGFSRLLQRVGVKPGSEVGGSSQSDGDSAEDSTSENREDLGDTRKKEGRFSGVLKSRSTSGNGIAHVPKSRTNNGDISSGSEREEEGNGNGGRQDQDSLKERNDIGRERSGQTGWIKRKMMVNEESESDENSGLDKAKHTKAKTTVPRMHQFENYSDESEDLDMEAKTRPMMDGLSSRGRGGDRGRGMSGSNRKRKSAVVRNQARSKYTEDIEPFTSSEEEHTPVKRGSRGCHFATPQTERVRDDMLRGGQRRRPEGAKSTDRADTEKQTERPSAVSFTGLKTQTSPKSKGMDGTIDSVLGGVKEVAYTHSNQHVVGGSKAEERLSRAAVRDVFERKMHSQIPANHLIGTQMSLSQSPPNSPPRHAAVRPQRPSVDHPVTFTTKTVHHTRHTTFIIGETPRAVCRQQLEEMAAKFKLSSVRQFAEEVLRSSSAQRLAWLRQYYTSLNHPELADIVKDNFPQPDLIHLSTERTTNPNPNPYSLAGMSSSSSSSTKRINLKAAAGSDTVATTLEKNIPQPQKKPRHPQNNVTKHQKKPRTPQNHVAGPQKQPRIPQRNVPEPQKKPRIPQKNILEPLSDIPSPESEEQEETVCNARGHKRTKRASVSSSGALKAGGGLGSHQANSSGLGPGEAAAFLDHRDRDTPSSPDLSHGWSTTPSKPTAQGEPSCSSRTREAVTWQRENPQPPSPPEKALSISNHRSLLTDLIGDTSILDDLLRPKPRGAQQRGSPKTPATSTLVSVSSGLTTSSPSRIGVTTNSATASLIHPLPSPSPHTPPTHLVTSPLQTSKGSRKDFWDILNEGNEESINRLTDLSEVERVCVNTNFKARTKSREEGRESAGLWKANEKFLWKK